MDLEVLLSSIVQHQLDYPSHGRNCACMDKYIRIFRDKTQITQEYVDQFNPPLDLRATQDRIDYVLRKGLERRP